MHANVFSFSDFVEAHETRNASMGQPTRPSIQETTSALLSGVAGSFS